MTRADSTPAGPTSSDPASPGRLPARPAGSPALGTALGAVAISFAPIFVESIPSGALGPTVIGAYRTLLGAVVLAAIALVRRESLRPSARGLFFTTLAGLLFAGDLFVWHRSIGRVGSGLATILGNTQVFWTAILGVALLRERLSSRFLLAVPIAIVGIALATGVVGGDAATKADPVGIGLGLGTALFYASYIHAIRAGRSAVGTMGPVAQMAWTSAACGVALSLIALAEGTFVPPPDGRTVTCLVGLALVAQVFGWVTLARCIPRVPAALAGLLLLLQPAFAVGWEVLLFHRAFTGLQMAGAVLTLLAIYGGSLARYSPASAPAPALFGPDKP
jgi:drug/metabolite transporter (DMT)-like permease